MRTYTRARIAGGVYFFTVNLAERRNNDLLVRHIAELREAFRRTQKDHPFVIDAIVILPEHLHCLWRLPMSDDDFILFQTATYARMEKMHEQTEHPTPLARLLEPVGQCLTPEVARRLMNLRADPAMQERLDELADKSTEGTLTDDEREEYETYVHAIDFIAILQAQSRHLLSDHSQPNGPV